MTVVESNGAIYKGLALLDGPHGPRLLVANFGEGQVDVFNGHFTPKHQEHGFHGVSVPANYVPFNVAVIDSEIYVSYAKPDSDGEDDVPGAGHGFINVFDATGHFERQLVRRGVLNSPWGMTIAPAGFGSFAGQLLVGNFGDGRINVVDSQSGAVVDKVRDDQGDPIEIEGLWGLLPCNGAAAETSDVWFSASPDEETHGLLGVLRSAD